MTDDSYKTPVSVLISTKNEVRNLGACLAGVSWADDIVVLDSFSDDDTVNIAVRGGARVVQREFDNFSAHKNWALDNIDFRHEWILIVDADERVTPELAREMRSKTEALVVLLSATRLRTEDGSPSDQEVLQIHKPIRRAQMLETFCKAFNVQLQKEKKAPLAPSLDPRLE